MPRLRTVYVCSDCGAQHPKWNGQCATCGAWNTLVEDVVGADAPAVSKTVAVSRALNSASEPLALSSVARGSGRFADIVQRVIGEASMGSATFVTGHGSPVQAILGGEPRQISDGVIGLRST